MSKFYPDLYLKTVYELKIEYLLEKGIKGLIFDLDDTLVTHGSQEVTKELLAYIKGFQDGGLKLFIVSNNTKKRVSPICGRLGLPFIWRGMKPLSVGLHKAMKLMKLKPSDICVVGDQVFSDVWGAKRAGMHSVLVEPLSKGGGFIVNFKRIFEFPIRRAVFKNMENTVKRGEYK